MDANYIAKFSASNDTYDVVKSEYVAMKLASLAGIDVADIRMEYACGKDVLLVIPRKSLLKPFILAESKNINYYFVTI